jgi:hypothetical protein
MKRIRLGNNRGVVIVDNEDYEELSKYKWSLHGCYEHNKYAYRKINGKSVMMHRVIMNPPSNMVIDHINGNGLDNRKANLRICTATQNKANNFSHLKGKLSKYKGVSLDHGLWIASIVNGNKKIRLGWFRDEKDAAMAYNEAASKYRGEFARLNIIGE